MKKTLADTDGRAIDLLLDRATADNDTNAFTSPVGDAVVNRIGAAEHILRLMALMPAEEPTAGLARRTLQRIDAYVDLGLADPGLAHHLDPNASHA